MLYITKQNYKKAHFKNSIKPKTDKQDETTMRRKDHFDRNF